MSEPSTVTRWLVTSADAGAICVPFCWFPSGESDAALPPITLTIAPGSAVAAPFGTRVPRRTPRRGPPRPVVPPAARAIGRGR